MSIGRLHVITDTVVQTRYSHEALAEMACAGGAGVIQLRDKQLDDDALTEVALRVREICTRAGAQLIINDRVEVARAVGADGVHLGQTDAPLSSGAGMIVGGTAGSVSDALAVERAGADYIGFGHIYATTSKHKPKPPVGIATLAEACAAVKTPIIAIGGITAATAADVMGAGAWGVAVIGAVCADEDPRAATARLAEAIARYS